MRRLLPLLLLAACHQAQGLEECPAGTVPVGQRCLVACASDLDCLSNETCDPAVSACRPNGAGADASNDDAEDRDAGPRDRDVADGDLPPPMDAGNEPDLVARAGANVSRAVTRGQELSIEFRIVNEGGSQTPQSSAYVYLNPVGELGRTADSILLATRTVRPLLPGSDDLHVLQWRVPDDLRAKTYWIVAHADAQDGVAESDETNNEAKIFEVDVMALNVSPSSVDFGTVRLGCPAPVETVTVTNEGAAAVNIDGISLSGLSSNEFSLESVPGTTRLAPGGAIRITISYSPIDAGRDTGRLIVRLASGLELQVDLQGEGNDSGAAVEHFTQSADRNADILFIVDDSCSMTEEQSALASYASNFLNALDQRNIDYSIAVTTTDIARPDAGQFVAPPITPATPDRVTALENAFNRGIEGSPDEAGLHAMYLALTEPLISGANAGFYRPTAWLAVVVISDEEDYSPSPPSFYSSFLQTLKSQSLSSFVSFNGIIGPEPIGCTGTTGIADPGTRYWDVIAATGGNGTSICTADPSIVLLNLGGSSFGLEFIFPLNGTVNDAGSLSVAIDGTPLPAQGPNMANWFYSPAANAIVFTAPSVPQPGAAVDVGYDASSCP